MKKFIILVLITCVLSSYSLYIYGKSVYDRYFVTGDINYREQSTINIVWYLQEKGYTKSYGYFFYYWNGINFRGNGLNNLWK